jgi:hypothetical protein
LHLLVVVVYRQIKFVTRGDVVIKKLTFPLNHTKLLLGVVLFVIVFGVAEKVCNSFFFLLLLAYIGIFLFVVLLYSAIASSTIQLLKSL